jgi:hypothetical protein
MPTPSSGGVVRPTLIAEQKRIHSATTLIPTPHSSKHISSHVPGTIVLSLFRRPRLRIVFRYEYCDGPSHSFPTPRSLPDLVYFLQRQNNGT